MKTKAQIEAEIKSLQGTIEQLKSHLATAENEPEPQQSVIAKMKAALNNSECMLFALQWVMK